MKTLANKIQNLRENYIAYIRENIQIQGVSGDYITFRDYVERESENDPTFFSWLFDDDALNNSSDLSNDQLDKFDNFLNDCSIDFDVYFNDENDSNNIGVNGTVNDCMSVIATKNSSYFEDYKGWMVSICDDESNEIYSQQI